MRDASIWSVIVFLLAVWVLGNMLGLEGLWWGMVVFVVARALSLWLYFAKVTERFNS